MQKWLGRGQNAERAAHANAEALIRRVGPDDAHLLVREMKRKAQSRGEAAHWRRVARAVARIKREQTDDDPTATMVD